MMTKIKVNLTENIRFIPRPKGGGGTVLLGCMITLEEFRELHKEMTGSEPSVSLPETVSGEIAIDAAVYVRRLAGKTIWSLTVRVTTEMYGSFINNGNANDVTPEEPVFILDHPCLFDGEPLPLPGLVDLAKEAVEIEMADRAAADAAAKCKW